MKSLWLASVCALTIPAIGYAQDTAPPPVAPSSSAAAAAASPTTAGSVAAADDGDLSRGEIVITATRRNQALSDVPIAVSAVSAESLQNSGANDIRSLNQLAPSLLVSSTGSEANGSARIRGIGTVGDNPGLESSVAVFIDGVYRSRTGAGLNELGEIDRIEVLRGPQGTLFGRNASAGLINIISKRPSYEFSANGEATYGNYDYYRFAAGITGPIIADKVAGRIDGVYVKRDGFYKDVFGGPRVNDRDRYFVRGQLQLNPTDDIDVRIIGDYTKRDENCCAATYLPSRGEAFDPTPGAANIGGFNTDGAVSFRNNPILDVLRSFGGVINQDTFSRNISVTPGRSFASKVEDYGLSGEVNWTLGFGKITSITAYRDYKAASAGDVDYNNADLLYRADDGNAFRQFKTFTQELRLQGTAFDDKLDFLFGGFYSNEKLKVSDNLQFGSQYGTFASCRYLTLISPSSALRDPAASGCLTPTGRATLNGAFGAALGGAIGAGLDRLSTVNNVGDSPSIYRQKSTNYAFFTHNVFNITDALALTVGVRYTHEKKEFSAKFNNTNAVCGVQQVAFSPLLPGGPAALTGSAQALVSALVNLTCQGNSTTALNALNLSDQRSESEFSGTAVLSYKVTPRLLTYASYSKGYKAGGFNLDRSALGLPIFAPSDPRNISIAGLPFGTANLQFDPEKVDAYEVGAKFGSRYFNLNFAAFRQEFKNFQLNTFNGSVFLVQTVNGCEDDLNGTDRDNSPRTGACSRDKVKPGVISQGFELEASMFPSRDLAITAGFTYAETEYAKNLIGNRSGQALDNVLFRLPGQQLSNAPKYVVTSSFAYTPSLGDSGMSLLFYADARMSSDYNTGSDLFPEKVQDSFYTVNARVGIRGKDQRWSLEFWGQNIFDKDYQQVAFNAPFQGAGSVAQTQAFGTTANQLFASFLAEPRTYGATARFRF